jgi:hypothetical protein
MSKTSPNASGTPALKSLLLTEYRGDGNFYPVVVIFGPGVVVFEADLKSPGPHVIGVTKDLGKGSLISGLRIGANIVVKQTPGEIYRLLEIQKI